MADLDRAVEQRDGELSANESMQESFAQLARGGDEAFDTLMADRLRAVEQEP